MDESHLQDRLYWGLNRTANILGRTTDAFRTRSAENPLDRSNRYLKLRAVFGRIDGSFDQPVGYGVAVWRGYFDASYTRVGDYLVQDEDTWFIASQHSLMPIMCVKTNRVISIARTTIPTTGAQIDNAYGNPAAPVISSWPASILGTSTDGKPATGLPGDTTTPTVMALLPFIHRQTIRPADVVTDDYGMTGVVVAAELSDLGWRLNIRHTST